MDEKKPCKCKEGESKSPCEGKGRWFFLSAIDFQCMKDYFEARENEGYADYIVIVGKPGNCPPGGCH